MTDNPPRILVVDDLPDWRITLSGMLTEAGYQVKTADSLASALVLIKTTHFDLAVVDVRLDEPDESNTEGLDLAEAIRQDWPAMKTIVITGYDTPETVKRAMEPNMQGQRLVAEFIRKSETGNLVKMVQRVLQQEKIPAP